ncbi:grasp-with-spasm system ATP-grasp peptide maturase [Chryseobacterium oryctis]|uniref:Grasp-with-spasm system ATP-grasp peptide maturase n=1 Tax=Chryseobacterium oryctis TaxID=2952618 RepID=A0ABT3HJH7_9FLAO|nr:grasp-with-spasm system ATP-grasp peptide maturase [Chryseobacterium oryctis]MCW3159929.1 grasp-with-spasm system ATP-grasp peptide maturase [Chryseobacterium oryctis]
MILIISNQKDQTTTEVIKWLFVIGKSFIRVSENETFEIKTEGKRIFLESKRNNFFLDEITSVWYRRSGIRFRQYKYKNESVDIHMHETQHWLQDYVLKKLESKKHINTQSNSHINKLLVLEKAMEVGLDVPKYFLSENTDDVVIDKTIVKPIAGNPMLESIDRNHDGIMYTSIVNKPEKEKFFISFFQEKIEKDFEIRCFYLDGRIWSMAIFSQNDDQTKVDHRKYNYEKPNRNVPYNLPKVIEEKIYLLMKGFDLNCGSIDFIKSGNKYYFLEINPIGQFGNVSGGCNYNLEKIIAEYL